MKRCPNCQRDNYNDAVYCYNCGQLLSADVPGVTSPVSEPPSVAPIVPAPPSYPAPPPYGATPPVYNPPPVYNSPPAYGASPAYPVYGQSGYNNPAYNYPDPANNPYFLMQHPLAYGAQGLPHEVVFTPRNFISFINAEGLLVFVRKANGGKRAAAFVLDFIIVIIALVLIGQLEGPRSLRSQGAWWVTLLQYIVFYGYFVLSIGIWGRTPGKRAVGLRVVNFLGRPPDMLNSLLRHCLGYSLSLACFGFGFFLAYSDSKGRGWHDLLARTLVIEGEELREGRDFSLAQLLTPRPSTPPPSPTPSVSPTPVEPPRSWPEALG